MSAIATILPHHRREDETRHQQSYTEESSLRGGATVTYASNDVPPQEQEEGAAAAADAGAEPEEDDNESHSSSFALTQGENSILALMQRLRFLFSLITFPIVPLGMMAVLALAWFLVTAFLLDNAGSPRLFSHLTSNSAAAAAAANADDGQRCSHPLHAYAWASLLLALYAVHHNKVRECVVSRSSSSSGNHRQRPLLSLRRVDQVFHALALLYVYAGISLLQTCHSSGDYGSRALSNDSSSVPSNEGAMTWHTAAAAAAARGQEHSSCLATCPVLTKSLTLYVAVLELFTLSLILPLLCLPCAYLWFLRQVTATASAGDDPDALMAALQHRLSLRHSDEDDDDVLLFGGLGVAGPIRNNSSGIISRGSSTAGEILQQLEAVKLTQEADGDYGDYANKVSIVSLDGSSPIAEAKDGALECCICMSDFYIHSDNGDVDDGSDYDDDLEAGRRTNEQEAIVRTPVCGHLFHRQCIASWVGGRWEAPQRQHQRQRQSARTVSPLRLAVVAAAAGMNRDVSNGDAAAASSADVHDDDDNDTGNNYNRTQGTIASRQQRQRRARRTTCPLCRADLRGGTSRTTTYNTF